MMMAEWRMMKWRRIEWRIEEETDGGAGVVGP